jgi:hypothetical protein
MIRVLFWLVIVAAYFLLILLICKCVSLARRNYERFTRPSDARGWADGAIAEANEAPEEALRNPSKPRLREATRMAR